MYATNHTAPLSEDSGANAVLASEVDHEDSPGALPLTVDSQELLRGGKSVAIRHNGSLYRLQATKLGKLILTK